jgi:hypothetical protein
MLIRGTSILFAVACIALAGCASTKKETLIAPTPTIAPYGDGDVDIVFAVLPLRNESGTTTVDCGILTDKLVAAAEDIQGVRTISQNAVLKIMASNNISQIRSEQEASQVAGALGVDGILVGTVNAYDPYTPNIGLTVALIAAPGAQIAAGGASPTLSIVSNNLDGKSQQVQLDVRDYAVGRVPPNSALSWRRYLASMDLFSEFACHNTLRDMMRKEWKRLGKSLPSEKDDDGKDSKIAK